MSESKDVVVGLQFVGAETDIEHTPDVCRTGGGFP